MFGAALRTLAPAGLTCVEHAPRVLPLKESVLPQEPGDVLRRRSRIGEEGEVWPLHFGELKLRRKGDNFIAAAWTHDFIPRGRQIHQPGAALTELGPHVHAQRSP